MPDTPVVYDDVEILEHDGTGFTCRIDGRTVFVGKYVPIAGTTVRHRGDRGRLTLPRWYVEQQELPLERHLTEAEVGGWLAVAELRVATAAEAVQKNPDDVGSRASLARARDELAAALSIRDRRRP